MSKLPGRPGYTVELESRFDALEEELAALLVPWDSDADAARIAALPKARYGIQLMTADQRGRAAIESYLRAASRELNPDLIMVFPTGSPDNPRVSVLYGNFDGRADAINGLGGLPAQVSRFRPYVRSFGAVRNDVRRGAL